MLEDAGASPAASAYRLSIICNENDKWTRLSYKLLMWQI